MRVKSRRSATAQYAFEPGTNFQHSNTGFEVAGAIIEAIAGMDYYDYVKKNIYDPAEMADSDCYHKDGPVENLAVGGAPGINALSE